MTHHNNLFRVRRWAASSALRRRQRWRCPSGGMSGLKILRSWHISGNFIAWIVLYVSLCFFFFFFFSYTFLSFKMFGLAPLLDIDGYSTSYSRWYWATSWVWLHIHAFFWCTVDPVKEWKRWLILLLFWDASVPSTSGDFDISMFPWFCAITFLFCVIVFHCSNIRTFQPRFV